jgi:ketosteroid isomerase-like protein
MGTRRLGRIEVHALARVVAFYESITSSDIARLGELYAADAFFKDPFNEVRGVPAIARIFEHMFVQVDAPRFAVRETVAQGDAAFLVWDFEFSFRRPLPAGPRRHLLRLDGDGPVEAIRVWFEIALDEERRLSTGPAGPPTHWGWQVHDLPAVIDGHDGDLLELEVEVCTEDGLEAVRLRALRPAALRPV